VYVKTICPPNAKRQGNVPGEPVAQAGSAPEVGLVFPLTVMVVGVMVRVLGEHVVSFTLLAPGPTQSNAELTT
jgi:hypothetical protein